MINQQNFSRLQEDDYLGAERIAYIDFRLRFTGVINRSDLKDMFGLGLAASSNMMSQYTKRCPDNMEYNRSAKANNIKINSFKPLIPIDAETALGMLAYGFNKNKLMNKALIPYVRVGKVKNKLNTDEVAKITRAIYGGYSINCNYISESSTNHGERTLLPTALVFDGRTWIFRAFDRLVDGSGKFKNFNFSRAINITENCNDIRRSYEEPSFDRDWNTQVPLILALHDDLSEEERVGVRTDFGMKEGENNMLLTERLALLWILCDQWRVEREFQPITSKSYRFKLLNEDMFAQLMS
ncbi:transcriptional regulator [Photobacterium carnosum]|uniref:WYL domain-containing protein n=1 Tax=Photobacterium carnosum TaxID=2023717 RepID=UPI00242F4450|nr:transcriptional regulator [Photobacterium carnosum]